MRLGLAAAILALVIRAAPLEDVIQRAREAAPMPLLLALALAGVGSLVLAVRLRFLARALGLSPTLGAAANVNLSALFYGLFLPGGNVTGGAIRFYRLAGPGRQVAAAAGALAWDRFSATLALCLTGLVFWLLAPAPKPAWPAVAFVLGAAVLLAAAAAGMVLGRGDSSRPVPRWAASGRLGKMLRLVSGAVRELARPRVRDHAVALGLSIGSQIIGTALYAALAAAIGVRIPLVTMGWIRAVVLLALLLPVTISGLGVREGALMVMLATQGVGEVPAVALGILVFGATILVPGLVGGVSEAIRLLRTER